MDAYLAEVERTRQPLRLLRDDREVARLMPSDLNARTDESDASHDEALEKLRGSILWQGDVISPIDEVWEAEQ
jgi:hypothetical protein